MNIFCTTRWARLLEWVLLAKGNKQIYTVSSPYYLSESARKNGGVRHRGDKIRRKLKKDDSVLT